MARWAVKPKTEGNTLTGAVDYDAHESRWRVHQDEKPFIDMVKQEREIHLPNTCLLYTSPSPRDS